MQRSSLFTFVATWLLSVIAAFAQVEELTDKVVTKLNASAATSIKTDQWYVMQNRGRGVYNFEDKAKAEVWQSSRGLVAGDDITSENAGFLLQFFPAGEDQPGAYYIMTGYGHWLCDVAESGATIRTTTDESQRGVYTIGKCVSSGHFWLKSESGYVFDGNGNGKDAVGYGTTTPTSIGGNNDHGFYAVTLGSAEGLTGAALVNRQIKAGGVFRFASQRTTSMSMADPADHKIVSQTTKSDNTAQWWLVQPLANGGVALRNYNTGLFMQATNGGSAQYTTNLGRSTLYMQASPKASATKSLVTISSKANYADKSCMHDDSGHKVVNWYANSASGDNPASDWNMTAVEDIISEEIKQHFDELGGYLTPANGITVQIRNVDTGRQISEDGNNKLLALEASATDYSQYWVMELESNGQYAFRNVKTGHYFNYTAGIRQAQSTSATKKASYIIRESDDAWQRTYLISSADGQQYYNDAPDHVVFNFTADDPASQWIFVKTEITAEEIEEAQLAYQAYTDIKANTSLYTTKMNEYFTDASYSELKANYQEMTDAQLRSTMQADNLPEYFIRIALKVKNNTWNEEDEMAKDFRVADYQVYSNHIFARQKTAVSYWYGRLSNPTGICVKSGDVLTVFCAQAQPSNATLQLEVVKGTSSEGTLYDLKKGINIFTFTEEANVFVFYQTSGMTVKLASCPDVRIHFEGGHLNGYYDKTRGHTNETWAHLRSKLLKHSSVLNIKTHNFVFHMKSDLVQKACPTDMEKLLFYWDQMAETEDALMGVNDTYIPGLSEVQRNIFNCFSMDHDFMYATTYGTYYEESTLGSIMSPSGIGSDALWGPAHENGHLRQNLINMVGTTESSNNLFSNVCVYVQGRTTQRAAAPATIFDHFASNTPWLKYDIWETTHMFYQLYLYFHVNGYMPDFYPRFFAKMRQNPMVQSPSSDIRGKNEYLKLARACCEVAQADLSEFFAAYGFFVPVEKYHVGDYGSYDVTTTQEDINQTLQFMHSFPKKLGNILFIEDRVSPVLATYEGHREGETKKRRSDDQVGSGSTAGDVGQYTTYLEDPSLVDYYYSVTSTGKVTVHGTGATGLVGFKVYDETGQLAYASNRFAFTLPAALRSQNYTLVAAMGDGTDIQLSTDLPEVINQMERYEHSSQASSIIDLQGRRVSCPVRGNIYIINGKKHIY